MSKLLTDLIEHRVNECLRREDEDWVPKARAIAVALLEDGAVE